MSRQADGRVQSRGVVLVASDNKLFMDIVGGMVLDADFATAFPGWSEAAERSIARTRPSVVICDCAGSEVSIRRLVSELTARRLPVLMAWSHGDEDGYLQDLELPERVAWITFPIAQEAFRSAIDHLLSPAPAPVRRLTLAGPGVTVEAAVRVRTLDEAPFEDLRDAGPGGTPSPQRTARRPMRLLP